METGRAPDSLEPFVGWKGLFVDNEGWLYSQHNFERWPEGGKFVASCRQAHEVPDRRCSCGVYALKSFEQLKDQNYNFLRPLDRSVGPTVMQVVPGMTFPVGSFGMNREHHWVLVNVYLWGRIRRGSIGWKATYATVKKVWVPPQKQKLGLLIAKKYNCKVGFIDRFTGTRI